jgi:hypothetical protein
MQKNGIYMDTTYIPIDLILAYFILQQGMHD